MLEQSKSVWARTEANAPIMSERNYNITIGMTLMWGFALNLLTVMTVPVDVIMAIPEWMLLVGYFICVIAGTMMFSSSDNPVVSFAGYNLVAIPIGIVLTPFILSFDPEIVQQALMVTTGFTGLMMALGTVYPKFFLSIGRTLMMSLISVIVIELMLAFVFGMSLAIMDWVVALIFCGYIGYDWARANQIPKTLDNAIDSAAALYLDIINLFIRILSILGRRD